MADFERENYYILLELSYDPAIADAGKIKSTLRARKQEWTAWQENPAKRNLALNYLAQLGDMERVLLDPVLREKEAQDALARRDEALRQFEAELRILESKGHILPREAAAIAVKYRLYGITQETVAKYANCPISDTAPPTAAQSGGEIIDRQTARVLSRNLALLGHSTLYAFLGELPYSPIKKLVEAAAQKQREASASGNNTPQTLIIHDLATLCVSLFETVETKRRYDNYLKVSRYPAVSELIDEEFARSQYVSPSVLLRIAGFAIEKYGIKLIEAEEYIKNYCNAYQIPLDEHGLQIACPCCGNQTLRDGAVCTVCSQPINGVCPSCSVHFEHGAATCISCGFSIAQMGKGLYHLGEAENALIESNWSTAQRNLQYAKKYWPDHPKYELLQHRALLLQERYTKYMESINDSVSKRQLYAAQELAREALLHNLRLPSGTLGQINRQIEDFEARLEDIKTQPKGPNADELLRMLDEVTDSMELARLLSSYPPPAPEKVVAGVTGRQVRLTWSNCQGSGITYLLVRKQGRPPLTAFDGDLLYEGTANSFLDKTAQPLAAHYYSVFSKRAGTYSRKGATSESNLILPEIEGLRILPVDGGAQLSWDFNPHIRGVKIWRKLGGEAPDKAGEGILLENSRLDGFSDTKLKNDVEYWYFLVASYIVEGRGFTSVGVCDSVIPHKTVAPIEDLVIAETESGDGDFIVSWNTSQHNDILLLCSEQKPAFHSGDILPIAELISTYRKLDLNYKRADSAQFRLGVSGGMYLFAAAVFGRFATVGKPRYLINVAEVEKPEHNVISGNLYINMQWPAGVSQVAVVYRFDRFPKRPNEAGSTKLLCSREQYNYDAGVLIKEPEPNIYYITIYAAFTAPDGSKVYSKGVELTINNQPRQEVYYSFTYKKKLFSSKGTLEVTLTSAEAFVLPKAVIVGKIGRLPLKRSDGLPLFEVEKELRVNGTLSFQYNTRHLPQDIYLRLFLHDDTLAGNFRFLPVSNMKIT